MQLTTIPLSTLLPPKGNPRKTLDAAQIIGLAQSIRTDGLLQNLVVRPEGESAFRVITGKRRYLALQRLKKDGAIDGDYQVPVDIKTDMTDDDLMRIATVENVQREQLHPMDEAEAFAKLLQTGGTVEAITDKTGLSAQTVKRRLALATLCPEAKKALRAGHITRTFAEALTLGTAQQQRSILETVDEDMIPEVDELRDMFINSKPALSMAIFPREQYTGTITTDLFSDAETSYFDDQDQFLSLQEYAVEALAEEYRKTVAWVEVSHLYSVPWWRYRDAEVNEAAGVVINLHPSGAVELRENLVRHEVQPQVVETVERTTIEPKTVALDRPEFASPLIRYVAFQKSAAVQAALLRNPRKAKEVAALLMLLGHRVDFGIRLSIHSCHLAPESERVSQRSFREIDAIAEYLAGCLGLAAGDGDPPIEGGLKMLTSGRGPQTLYEAMGQLADEDLESLMILLPIVCFGQSDCERFDTGDGIFNKIAQSIGVSLREWWTPDEPFLSALRHEQVLAVAEESGATEKLQGLAKSTKKNAVDLLSRYFATAQTVSDGENDTAKGWLPGFFGFPARKTLNANRET